MIRRWPGRDNTETKRCNDSRKGAKARRGTGKDGKASYGFSGSALVNGFGLRGSGGRATATLLKEVITYCVAPIQMISRGVGWNDALQQEFRK